MPTNSLANTFPVNSVLSLSPLGVEAIGGKFGWKSERNLEIVFRCL
jgi:hypothetical protein